MDQSFCLWALVDNSLISDLFLWPQFARSSPFSILPWLPHQHTHWLKPNLYAALTVVRVIPTAILTGWHKKTLVNFNDSDITIQSSDGVLFGLHQVNMKINLGFWESIQPKSDAVIQFPEKSATLDLLFQFCYPERHPDLNDLAFDILTELAEAAEKYEVFSAINICKIAMKCVGRHDYNLWFWLKMDLEY